MKGVLVIVPCGQAKIWDRQPELGPVAARDAYTGSPFKVNRRYAEHFAERWVILSAKYGFIAPDYEIPGPYNVTFKKKSTQPISVNMLKEQIVAKGLCRFETIIGLGGKNYLERILDVFSPYLVDVFFPFAGLYPPGVSMGTINRAIKENILIPDRA